MKPRRAGGSLLTALVVLTGLAGAAPASAWAGTATRITPGSLEQVVLVLDPRTTGVERVVASEPPLVRADRLQYQHRYAEAAAVLDQWIQQHPADAAVLVKRAQVRVALGQARGALADCVRAGSGLDALTASACRALAMGALGATAPARNLVEQALARDTSSPETTSWAQGIAAELAAQSGDFTTAERWHRAALANAGNAHYPRVAYAEFLLARGRRAEVLTLLDGARDDSTVMRLRRLALEPKMEPKT